MTGERYEVHYKRPDGALALTKATRWRMIEHAEWEAEIAARHGLRAAIVDLNTRGVIARVEPDTPRREQA